MDAKKKRRISEEGSKNYEGRSLRNSIWTQFANGTQQGAEGNDSESEFDVENPDESTIRVQPKRADVKSPKKPAKPAQPKRRSPDPSEGDPKLVNSSNQLYCYTNIFH